MLTKGLSALSLQEKSIFLFFLSLCSDSSQGGKGEAQRTRLVL